jgi:O-antigen/teichoic acid export membrane protein
MRKIPRNFLVLFTSDIISRLLGFLATVYLARLLGAQGLGLLGYGMAFLTYALLFTNPGLTTIAAREIAKQEESANIVGDVLGLRIMLTIAVFIIFALGLFMIPGSAITKKVILYYLFSMFPFALVLEFVFQGRQDMEYIGISRLLQYSVYIILLFLFIKHDSAILRVPVYFFFGYMVAALFLIVVYIIKYKKLSIKFSPIRWRGLLGIAAPVGVATIFNQISLNLAPVVLGVLFAKSEVGFFSASFKIIAMLLIIERVFHFVFFPVISRQYTDAPERLNRSFSFLTKILFAITIPLSVVGIILAPRIIYFIYGLEFQTSILVFQALLLYFLITPINTMFGYGLVAINQQRKFFRVIAYTALFNSLLTVILSANFKAVGAGLALFISELFGIVFMSCMLKRHVQFPIARYVIRPLLVSLLVGLIVLLLLYLPIVWLLVLAVVIYIIFIFLFRIFSKDELQELKRSFSGK